MTRAISVLGCTGSIGRQTLQVASELGVRVTALAATNGMIGAIEKAIAEHEEAKQQAKQVAEEQAAAEALAAGTNS